MSYLVHVVVPRLPRQPALAWEALENLRQPDEDDGARDPKLVRLHDTLTQVYPCLSSYRADDPRIDDCPWSDGPLIDNFGSEVAVLGLAGPNLDEVLPFLVESAGILGLTVLDEQAGAVHEPLWVHPTNTWRVLVRGLRPGFERATVAAELAHLSGRDEAEVQPIFDARLTCVKKGIDRLGAVQYRAALRKIGCHAVTTSDPAPRRKVFTEIDLMGGNDGVTLASLKIFAGDGYANHQFELGYLLQYGVDMPVDIEAAAGWYEKAAAQGYAKAQYAISTCYQGGFGVPQNDERALEWLRKAADAGIDCAQCALAERYAEGKGVRRDARQARQWFHRAAEQGYGRAQALLACLLIEGECGGTPAENRRLAIHWASKAAEQGDQDAARFVQRLANPGK
jgi:hypothetical protein